MGIPVAASTINLKKLKSEEPTGSALSAVLLFLLILAVCVGPRLRVSGEGEGRIDIRYQDILLIPAMFHLFVANGGKFRLQLTQFLGAKLPFFLWSAMLVTIFVAFTNPEVDIIRRAFFLGRGFEMFVIASVAAGLYISAGINKAPKAAIRAVYIAAYGNAAWMAYQIAAGTTGTLLGSSVGATIESYGPKLIGEGSAFGTGQFFAFTAAVAVAQLRSGYGHRLAALMLLAISAGGAWVSESRISIGVVTVCVAVLLVLASRRGNLLNIGRTILAVVLLWMAAEFVLPQLSGRQSVEGIEAGVGVRVEKAWDPLFAVLANNPLLGAGPGGLVGDLPVEAHNIYLRAVTDYGLVIGPLFIFIFLSAMARAFRASRNYDLSLATRMFANVAFLAVLCVLVSGFVQDSLTGVMSSHLTMISIGLLAGALLSRQEEPEPKAEKVKALTHQRSKWLSANDHRRFQKKRVSAPSRPVTQRRYLKTKAM